MQKPKPTLNHTDAEIIREIIREEIKPVENRLRAEIRQSKTEVINEIATVIANTVLPVQEDHAKRILRVEKHLSLKTP